MPKDAHTQTESDEYAPTELADENAGATRPAQLTAPGAAAAAGNIGRFRLGAPLGSGGMADVYRAYDPMLDRTVALKVLRTRSTSDDQQRMRRVLREARAAAALTHPNTVTIFEVGEADGEVFIAMELLEGESLRSLVGRARGEVSLEQKLRWLRESALALAAAHERGLVHRDVKPDNMFVCTNGTLKLLDFGIAKREDDSEDGGGEPTSTGPSSMQTAEGRRVGTPRYMAPEQHAGQGTDARTDEYAWGLVAFELLTGKHLVAGLSTVTMEKNDESPPLTPMLARIGELRAHAPELGQAVALAIARALEPLKEDRFSSMKPIVEALERKEEPREARVASAVSSASTVSTATSPAPPRQPRSSRWWIPVLVVSASAIAGVVGVRSVLRSRADARVRAAPARPLLPGCVVEPARSLTLGTYDRVAVLPNGELVVARDITQGLVLMRETPTGPVSFTKSPFLTGLGNTYRDVQLQGMMYQDVPSVIGIVDQGAVLGDLAFLASDGPLFFAKRIKLPVSGLAMAAFGKAMLFGVTTSAAEGRAAPEVLLGATDTPRFASVESGAASAPALATSEKHVAFAYVHTPKERAELHLSMLDEAGQRIGDVHVVSAATSHVEPAVALVGTTATVFWVDDGGPRTRLTMSRFTLGDAAVSVPKVVLDEPVTPDPPLAARLPNGGWALAWVASTASGAVLRISPMGPDGALTGPTDVAVLPRYSAVTASAAARGIELSWVEAGGSGPNDPTGKNTAKFVNVTCAPKR